MMGSYDEAEPDPPASQPAGDGGPMWNITPHHGVMWKNECDITHDVFLCSL